MSRVSSDDSGAGYTDQLVLCLMLILCVSISLGAYIVRFNAQIDRQRELSPVHLLECGQGRGAFIVDPHGRLSSSDNCYLVDEDN
ncbi:hypothetical protein [Pseudomonas protegens]|uniref:Uncharacterized protein n=1 Tax=Pseudomonas protegens (strain DSM 19095 / LMG 27888 / CFBP 6595 / CHA0) TaxID=1124983 RepID=A0A2C9ET16_PSEPH|nr:hypothetical protein [Pseudomonas protegens]AGL86817.1 hypothetical protein PFLCHA0_c50680 [Pseudomonas protegens CHA0]MBP5108831.1 hypothetical protein [Pseudomonas protegens]QTU27747.1 hypothetical protein HUT21_26235 [Pseudomonas protegens]QTU31383.1 hypothetical protein HUT20_12865 [Pseudomonas protegens]RLO24621.1 hypothetical protein EAG75_03070 [Pseudomonas protegens]